ncbi:MAG: F0F1 ATP synthase subunit A [Anaerolineae bacterium]|nr:F0F1 ATP synthase subunit A [Anaerolineae bacterium]
MKTGFSTRGCLILILALLASMGLCVVGVFLGGVANKQAMMPEISLAAEEIPLPFKLPLFGDHIPNTLPSTWLTMFLLILLGFLYRRALRTKGSSSRFVVAVEAVGEGMLRFMENAVGAKARLFFPLVATFFLFIALSNWCGILPGFGSVGVWVVHHAEAKEGEAHAEASEEKAHEGEEVLVPFFRSANAHLSTTLALAIVSVAAAQYFGVRALGRHYWRRYLNFRATSPKPDPTAQNAVQRLISRFARGVEVLINGIVGLLEIALEALKVLPFSFRLFGNIFAGEVLLFVVSYLFAFVFPMVFLGLELFVGFLQGLIFSMLTLIFFSIATTAHHEEAHH